MSDGTALNAVGLRNPGANSWVYDDMPSLLEINDNLIVSVWGCDEREFARCAAVLSGLPGVLAWELNLSCPNCNYDVGSLSVPIWTARVVDRVARYAQDLPLWAKIGPARGDVKDLVEIARVCWDAGIRAVVVSNSLPVDASTFDGKWPLCARSGGLSGPVLRASALNAVQIVKEAVPSLPVIGCGGICGVDDVMEMLSAGACGVQVCASIYKSADFCLQLVQDLWDRSSETGLCMRDVYGEELPSLCP